MTIDKDANKLVEVCIKYTMSGVKVHKIPGDPVTNLSKSDLEKTYNIDKYRSFVVQLMLYITKVGPDVENTSRDLTVHMIHPGP